MGQKSDLIQGTLDLLILRTLAAGPKHGWGKIACLVPARRASSVDPIVALRVS